MPETGTSLPRLSWEANFAQALQALKLRALRVLRVEVQGFRAFGFRV